MQKTGFIRVILVPMIGVLLFSGCASAGPDRPAEEVVKEGISNLSGMTAYTYDVALKGDVTDASATNVKFDFKLNGQLDALDEKATKLVMRVDGSASNSASVGGSGSAELRMNGDDIYFNVADLKVDGEGNELPAEMTDLFGKWWQYSLPAGLLKSYGISFTPASEDEKTKMKENLDKIIVFAKPEYVGTDDVMGEESYHYKVTVDKKGLVDFSRKSAEDQGQTVSDEEVAQNLEQLNNVDIAAEIWVGSKSKVINKFKGSLTMKGTSPGEGKGIMSADVTLGDFGKALSIEVPDGAAEFPMEALAGAMMGGSMTSPTDEEMMMMMMDDGSGIVDSQ
ncbi:hypothetical protein KJ835_04465 [Patescibacteria group bacterium]|nr:hypothetical protein [Patescibacteria group bacterium]MBU1953940.1 hypothetical protein [Patescibacteria group bacterium]